MTDLFRKQVQVYLIYFIVKKARIVKVSWQYCQHFMIILNSRCFLYLPSEWLCFPPFTLRKHSLDLSFFCFFVKNACVKKPCPSNAICQAGFSSEGYRCVCVPGYTGKDCAEGEADICFQYLSVSSHVRKSVTVCFIVSPFLMHLFSRRG